MSAIDDVARMLALVPWLRERQGATVAEAATAFGVSEDVVRRDLYRLDFCGLPGLGGGDLFDVTIVGDRVTVAMADELRRPLRLTPREALRLVLTLDAVAVATGDRLPALASAVRKLRQALGVPDAAAVELATDATGWLEPLREAIAGQRRVRLTYRGRTDDAPRPRAVDPWLLRVVGGVWYLQGHDVDAGGPRTFRLDRIAEVAVLDVERGHDPPTEPPPAPRYVPGPDEIDVEVVLEPGAAWVADAVDAAEVDREDGGRLRLRFGTDAPTWVARILLAAGGAARVVRPPELADHVATHARRALDRYGPPEDDRG